MTDKKADWSWVSPREWMWNEGNLECGVHTYEGKLVWWSRPLGPTGYMFENGKDQSFEDFIAFSSPFPVPSQVLDELRTLLRRQK
jgi:hypothetical protein